MALVLLSLEEDYELKENRLVALSLEQYCQHKSLWYCHLMRNTQLAKSFSWHPGTYLSIFCMEKKI